MHTQQNGRQIRLFDPHPLVALPPLRLLYVPTDRFPSKTQNSKKYGRQAKLYGFTVLLAVHIFVVVAAKLVIVNSLSYGPFWRFGHLGTCVCQWLGCVTCQQKPLYAAQKGLTFHAWKFKQRRLTPQLNWKFAVHDLVTNRLSHQSHITKIIITGIQIIHT